MQRGIELLSQNDLRALQKAMDTGREIQLEREWADGTGRVLASTLEADPAWAPAKMLLRVETWGGGWYSSQYFDSVKKLCTLRGRAVPT